MQTPRSSGLLSEALALQDAAQVLGAADLQQRAGTLLHDVTIATESGLFWQLWWSLPDAADELGSEIAARCGVNPLDVAVETPPAAGTAANDLSSGNPVIAAGTTAQAAADAAGNAIGGVTREVEKLAKWLLIALVILGALYIVTTRKVLS